LDELSVGVSIGFTVSDSFSSDLAVSETGFSTFPPIETPTDSSSNHTSSELKDSAGSSSESSSTTEAASPALEPFLY